MFKPARPRLLVASATLLIIVALLSLLDAKHEFSPALSLGEWEIPSMRPTQSAGRLCAGWNPHLRREHDPPKCKRARQFRQIQDFRADPKHDYVDEVWKGLERAEKCVLGYIDCPEEPIIVADWWYMIDAMRKSWSAPGEGVWLEGVVDAVQDEGFAILPAQQKLRARHLLRALSELVHMYWAQDIYAFQCVTDPTCIRPEDYQPSANPKHRRPQPSSEEVGVTPLWKIFAQTYWGARPVKPHDDVTDRTLGDPADPEWSYNPLGKHFVMTPWPYPGHSWIPITMERNSLYSPAVPWEERNNTVVILAKRADIFYDEWLGKKLLPHWDDIGRTLATHGFELLAMAEDESGAQPIPAAIRSIGRQGRTEYQATLGQAKVLLGIGRPEISPSPFVALGKGLSLVMPYKGSTPTPPGYELYEPSIVQHGPINAIGEPYVHTYNADDVKDLKRALLAAISTPMESYTPPDYTERHTRAQARKFLWHDYERDYRKAKKANDGQAPGVSDIMLQRCFQDGRCNLGPLPDN